MFAVYWVGFGWVLCPFPCDVFAVYLPGIPPLAPSDTFSNLYWVNYLFVQRVTTDYHLGSWVSGEVCAQLVAHLDWGIFDWGGSEGWGRVMMYRNTFEEWVIQYLAIGDGMLLEYCNKLWATVSILILPSTKGLGSS